MKFATGFLLAWLMFSGKPAPETPADADEYICENITPYSENYDDLYYDCHQKFLEENFGMTKQEFDNMTSEPWPELVNGVDELSKSRVETASDRGITDDPDTEIWEELKDGV
jgi:hypothetical protein